MDQLFNYRNQLNIAKEVIKLLEQQREIYRILIDKCQCNVNSNDHANRLILNKLNEKLGYIYEKCHFSDFSNGLYIMNSVYLFIN